MLSTLYTQLYKPPFACNLPGPSQSQTLFRQLIWISTPKGSFIHFILELWQDGLWKGCQAALPCHLSHKFALKRISFPPGCLRNWAHVLKPNQDASPTATYLSRRDMGFWFFVFLKPAMGNLESQQTCPQSPVLPKPTTLPESDLMIQLPLKSQYYRGWRRIFSEFQAGLTYKALLGVSVIPRPPLRIWGSITTTSPILGSSPQKLLSRIWKQMGGAVNRKPKQSKTKRKAQSVPGS